MPMDLGTRNTLLCDFMHCMTAVSLEMSDEPYFSASFSAIKYGSSVKYADAFRIALTEEPKLPTKQKT